MKRSNISVVSATAQPPFSSPTMRSSPTRAPLKKTSLKPWAPFIWCSGRTSTPGWSVPPLVEPRRGLRADGLVVIPHRGI
jgi:hypothetical protein